VVAVPVVDFDVVICHEAQSAVQAAASLVLEQSYYPVEEPQTGYTVPHIHFARRQDDALCRASRRVNAYQRCA